MANKKKAAKKTQPRARRPSAPRRAAAAIYQPAVQPEIILQDRGSNNGVLTLLVIGLAAIIWLLWQGRHQQKVPAPASATPTAAQAPAGRSITTPKPALSGGGAPSAGGERARREAAGAVAETGAPTMTLDRSLGKPLSFRCWRPEGSQAQLDIFGARNKRFKTVKSEAGAAGWVNLNFDGKDEQGAKLPDGLYYLRASGKDEQAAVTDVWVKG